MIKLVLRILHMIGGDNLLLKIMIMSGSPFFEYISGWPVDGPQVNVMVFASNKFHLDSFMSSWSTDDPETKSLS